MPAKEGRLSRIRRAHARGQRWCQVYWRQVFQHNGLEVNAAAVPTYMLERVERGEASMEDVFRALSRSSSRETAGKPEALEGDYRPLWDEAVTYVLGVRQDILRASAAAEFALKRAEDGKWLEAFKAATVAGAIEREHSGNPTYWGPLLAALADALVELGYVRDHDSLRSYSQAPSRAEDP